MIEFFRDVGAGLLGVVFIIIALAINGLVYLITLGIMLGSLYFCVAALMWTYHLIFG